MEFAYSDKVAALQDKLEDFMDRHIYPNEAQHEREIETGDRWQPTALIEELKKKARLEGLWNLFLPHSPRGAGLSNLEYAPLCEIMGRAPMALGGRSTAPPPTPATWRRWSSTATRRRRSSGWNRCWPARSARASP